MLHIIDELLVAQDLAARRWVAAVSRLEREEGDGAASRFALRGWAGDALIRVGHWLEGTPRGVGVAICPPASTTTTTAAAATVGD